MGSEASLTSMLLLQRQLALRCAAILLLVGTLATAALLVALARHNHEQAQAGLQAIAHSVAQTLSTQMARAARLGIPLQQLPGVEAHLEQTLANTPELAYLAIADIHGYPMYSVSHGSAGPLQSLPISVKGQSVALVQAGPRRQPAQGLIKPAVACAALVLLTSALLGAAVYLGPARRMQRRHALLQNSLRDATPLPLSNRDITDPLHQALHTLASLQHRNQQAHQAMLDYAAEIRSVEFDKKTLVAIDAIATKAIKMKVTQ